MFERIEQFDIASISVGRQKSEMRSKMDALQIGEGFIFRMGGNEEMQKEKHRAERVSNNLNPKGKGFSIQWIENKAGFRVVRTR